MGTKWSTWVPWSCRCFSCVLLSSISTCLLFQLYSLLQSLSPQVRGDLSLPWGQAQASKAVVDFQIKKSLLAGREKKSWNLQTESSKRRITCLLIMIMLSEAYWHNEGIITNYAGLCFHTFMTNRHGSGQVVTDFRRSCSVGTKELKHQ